MAETLYEKALRLLGRPTQKALDPDDADNRIPEEAQPTDSKLEGAGEEASAGAEAAPEGGDAAGVPADPGAGEEGAAVTGGDGDGDEGKGGEGDSDGDEGQDMSPDDIRELRKAFGLTVEEDINDIAKGKEVASLLASILAHMQKTDAYMQNLNAELADLKAQHSSGKAEEDLRPAMKSIDSKIDTLQKLVEGMHRTAPAAGAPKAIVKANPEGSPKMALTLADVTKLAMDGKISASETARLTKQINNQPPAFAGN